MEGSMSYDPFNIGELLDLEVERVRAEDAAAAYGVAELESWRHVWIGFGREFELPAPAAPTCTFPNHPVVPHHAAKFECVPAELESYGEPPPSLWWVAVAVASVLAVGYCAHGMAGKPVEWPSARPTPSVACPTPVACPRCAPTAVVPAPAPVVAPRPRVARRVQHPKPKHVTPVAGPLDKLDTVGSDPLGGLDE